MNLLKSLSVFVFATSLAACDNANQTAANTVTLTNEQSATVSATERIFLGKKDSLNKQYDSLLHKTALTPMQKDSIKKEKKKNQMNLKMQENDALGKTLDADQLVAYQQQKEKKQESVEEKAAKKMLKLKEEYALSGEQVKLIQPVVAASEKEKAAIKNRYSMEGKDKTEVVKKEEKAFREKIETNLNLFLQKNFTGAQNVKLRQKLVEKAAKEKEKTN